MGVWISDHSLEVVHSKTEADVLSAKRAYRQPVLLSEEVRIPVMCVVKYLGITLDSKFTFTRHIQAVLVSAATSARAVGRLMPNVGRPSVAKRRLLP